MLDYLIDDDLFTFEGWLKFQAIDLDALPEDQKLKQDFSLVGS